MGKKRKRSKQNTESASSANHGKLWPDHTVDEILSYLHSQIAFLDPVTESRRDRDFEDVDEELARHLNRLGSNKENSPKRLGSYSARQIRAKLSRVYNVRKLTENDDTDWTVIYAQGFACLDWTDDRERRVRMAHRSKEIKHNLRWEILHSPRKTRAGRQVHVSIPSVPRRGLRASSSSNTSGLLKSVAEPRVAGSRRLKQKRAINGVQTVSETQPLGSSGGEIIISKVEDVAPKPFTLSTSEHGEIPRVTASLRDFQEILESEPESYGTPLRSFSAAGCGNDGSDERKIEEPPSILELEQRVHAVEEELRMVKRNAELDVDFWKAKYRTAQDERLKWRKAKDILAAELNVLRSPSSSELPSNRFVEREAFFDDLLVQWNSYRRIEDLKSDVDMKPDDETIAKVSKLMQRIRDYLQAAFKDVRFASMVKLPKLSQDHLLVPLFEHAFGVEWDSQEKAELLEQWRKGPELRRYGLLALCGAALAHWVFQQTQADILFDRYQDVGTRSSTNRYRDAIQLVGQSDAALARTVDLMVHKSLAEEDSLQHFQRAKGKNLARKFQEASAPLCELDPDTGELSDANSDADEYAIDFLSDAFASAIDVQSRLVLTGRRFECAWHKPGTLFDHTSMSSYGRAHEGGATETATVRLTLLPGINLVMAGGIDIDFGGFAERRHREHERTVCLVRAVVLRGSADRA